MGAPATTGQLRENIEDMQVGDYVKVNVDTGWVFALGSGGKSEMPSPLPFNPMQNFWYAVKVTEGLLISDRVIYKNSWDYLNSFKLIQGGPTAFGNVVVRSLTGGASYVDEYGNKSTEDKGFGGWPTNNEWDKYVVNFPTELIQDEKTLEDVFHYGNFSSWVQDTPTIEIMGSIYRVLRGRLGDVKFFSGISSDQLQGFRPVFEYREEG
ncbi:hypothetical protein ACSVDA_11935 [Cytobacillus sp. Hm23]